MAPGGKLRIIHSIAAAAAAASVSAQTYSTATNDTNSLYFSFFPRFYLVALPVGAFYIITGISINGRKKISSDRSRNDFNERPDKQHLKIDAKCVSL